MLDYVMITNTKLCSQEGRGKCFSRNSEVIFMEKQQQFYKMFCLVIVFWLKSQKHVRKETNLQKSCRSLHECMAQGKKGELFIAPNQAALNLSVFVFSQFSKLRRLWPGVQPLNTETTHLKSTSYTWWLAFSSIVMSHFSN